MNCKRNSFGKFILSLLLFLSVSSSLFSQPVVLTDAQREEIWTELTVILNEARALKMTSAILGKDSEEWKKKCQTLEAELLTALQKLENSQVSLIEYQRLAERLKLEVQELRKQHEELLKSSMKQKAKTRAWATVALILAGIAITEGAILIVK